MASRLDFDDEAQSFVEDFDSNETYCGNQGSEQNPNGACETLPIPEEQLAPESYPICNQGSEQSLYWTTPQQQSESHQSLQNNISNQGSGLLTKGRQQFGGEITEKIIRKRQIDKKYRENRRARQQETKSNLEQLKREMQEKERQWMNDLKISEVENGRLKNEIQEKVQLCESYQVQLVALIQEREQLKMLNQTTGFQRELPIANRSSLTQSRELDHPGHDYDSEEQVHLFPRILNEVDLNTSLKILINPLLWCHFDEISRGKDNFGLPAKDSTGRIWSFLCTIKKTDGVWELVFEEGWLNFVQSKRLKIGLLVLFRKDRDRASEAHYRIEVKRSIIFMGKLSWLDWSAD